MSARRHIAPGPAAPRHSFRILPALSLAVVALLILSARAQAVDFQASPATARVGQSVAFTPGPDGAGAALSWAYGDGTTGADASHSYAAAGSYTVTLTATAATGETTTSTQTVRVVGDPVAAFSAPAAAEVGSAVGFNAGASVDPGGAIASYAWNFGDGSTGSGQTASHRYTTGGDQTVTLTVTAALDGRTASVSHTVHINVAPVASFSYAPVGAPAGQDPLTPLVGQQVRFDAGGSSDPDGSITRYAWDLGTGAFGTVNASTVVTAFATAGTKDIRLRVTDDRGATTTARVRLRVNSPPTVGFTIAPAAPLTGATVTFTSTASDPDGAADLAVTSWDLNGDGSYSEATGATATAVFLTAGTYTIGVKVTDKGGAASVLTKTLTVAGPPAPPPPPRQPADGSAPTVVVPSPGAPVVGEPKSIGGAPVAAAPAPIASGAGSAAAVVATGPRALRGVRVQLTGSVTASRTRISRIVVLAPAGARVAVRCRGKGCPARGLSKRMSSSGRLRVAMLERTLWSGARITVSIAKPGFATRRIVLTMRRGRAPARSDGCLIPTAGSATKVGRCPTP